MTDISDSQHYIFSICQRTCNIYAQFIFHIHKTNCKKELPKNHLYKVQIKWIIVVKSEHTTNKKIPRPKCQKNQWNMTANEGWSEAGLRKTWTTPNMSHDSTQPPHWPNGKAFISRAADLSAIPAFTTDLFPGWIQPVTQHWYSSGLLCRTPGIIGSALGLVGPVPAYSDWVKQKVWSTTSISVWQHVRLSEEICPWNTLGCCWNIRRPTNNCGHDKHFSNTKDVGQLWTVRDRNDQYFNTAPL